MSSYELRQSFQKMSTAVPGSYNTMAQQLGLSESGLEARIYERKGQTVSVRQAMVMQEVSNRTDFAETVARLSGGVFVKLPEEQLSEKDIQNNFLNLGSKIGEFINAWRDVVADGVLTKRERRRLDAVAQELYVFACAIVLLTAKYYNRCEDEGC